MPDPAATVAALDAQLAELRRLIALVRALVLASRVPPPPADAG